MKVIIILQILFMSLLISCKEQRDIEARKNKITVDRLVKLCLKNYTELCCETLKLEAESYLKSGLSAQSALRNLECINTTSNISNAKTSGALQFAAGAAVGHLLTK